MKNEVINLHGWFQVVFEGRVLRPTWMSKGPAQTCLDLLERGRGTVTDSGNIRWKLEREQA